MGEAEDRAEKNRAIQAGEIIPFEPYRKIAKDPIPPMPKPRKRGKKKESTNDAN